MKYCLFNIGILISWLHYNPHISLQYNPVKKNLKPQVASSRLILWIWGSCSTQFGIIFCSLRTQRAPPKKNLRLPYAKKIDGHNFGTPKNLPCQNRQVKHLLGRKYIQNRDIHFIVGETCPIFFNRDLQTSPGIFGGSSRSTINPQAQRFSTPPRWPQQRSKSGSCQQTAVASAGKTPLMQPLKLTAEAPENKAKAERKGSSSNPSIFQGLCQFGAF